MKVIEHLLYPFARDIDDRDSFTTAGTGSDDKIVNLFGVRARQADFSTIGAQFCALQIVTDIYSICHQVVSQSRGDLLALYRVN